MDTLRVTTLQAENADFVAAAVTGYAADQDEYAHLEREAKAQPVPSCQIGVVEQ